MSSRPLYQQIAESIRQQILDGSLKAGDQLPPVRAMTQMWNCTTGTVQRAYQQLASDGLIEGRTGHGTRVVGEIRSPSTPLRRAALIHKAESFLLEVVTEGYPIEDIEEAVRQALNRWRVVQRQDNQTATRVVRFNGSHDVAVTWLASHFEEIALGHTLQLNFSGSLGGLIALAEGKTDLAGCHLWDEEANTYNLPFVRRILPGEKTVSVHLADRRIGLILSPGNPLGIKHLGDLTRPGLRFLNRQAGSGTRVWLDANLRRLGVDPVQIAGYAQVTKTHSDLARAIAEGQANCGLGLEAAARFYELDFIFLTQESYDLICLRDTLSHPAVQAMVHWLQSAAARRAIGNLPGYKTDHCGEITMV